MIGLLLLSSAIVGICLNATSTQVGETIKADTPIQTSVEATTEKVEVLQAKTPKK